MAALKKRTQYGTVTIAANSNSGTATLSTSVDTSKAYAVYLGFTTTDTTYTSAQDFPDVVLTNSTTVTATTSATNTGAARVLYFMVEEYISEAITSIQVSTVSLTGTTNTATINSVTTTRAWAEHTGAVFSGASNDWNYYPCYAQLTDATTVTVTRAADGVDTPSVKVVTVDVAAGYTDSVQSFTGTIAGSASTQDVAISAVTDGDTQLRYGGWTQGLFTSQVYARWPYMHRTSTTNVRLTRGATAATNATVAGVAVEWAPGLVKSRQAGQTTIATTTSSLDTAVSAVNTDFASLVWLGRTSNGTGSGNAAIFFSGITLLDLDTVRQLRGTTDAITVTDSWELLEAFAAYFDTLTETVTATDTVNISGTLRADVTESNTVTDTVNTTMQASVTLSESQTLTDSYDSLVAYTNTITETNTVTDTVNILASSVGAVSESNSVTDALDTSLNSSVVISESSSVTDTVESVASVTETLSETTTVSDNLADNCIYQNGVEETCSPADEHAALLTAVPDLTEEIAANDNYEATVIPAGGEVVVENFPGPSDSRWDDYLKWLKKKKRKQLKKRAATLGVGEKIVGDIDSEVSLIVTKKITSYNLDFEEERVRSDVQKTVLAIYDIIWEKRVREFINEQHAEMRRREEEEAEFFMMMM